MTDLTLSTRTCLPDALRVLLEKHPRGAWEAHPNFSELTRFWLERHLMFRRLQAMLLGLTETSLDRREDPRQTTARLGRLASMFLNELHGHHSVEDLHYFPALCRLEPRLEEGFVLLDTDHHALDPLLHSLADRTDAVLRGAPKANTEMGRLHTDLTKFATFLDRHLTDEEEIVVPVILEHGARIE